MWASPAGIQEPSGERRKADVPRKRKKSRDKLWRGIPSGKTPLHL